MFYWNFWTVVDTKTAPSEYVVLHGKRDFMDVMKDVPGLFRWAQCDHKSSHKREVEGLESEKKIITTEADLSNVEP